MGKFNFPALLNVSLYECDLYFVLFLQFSSSDDFFEEVKQRKPIFNEYLDSFIMDQQKKQYKVVLEDGEFSDEVLIINH